MRESEKARNELASCLAKRPLSEAECFDRVFGGFPASLREEVLAMYLEKARADSERAAEWAATLAGILYGDYDGGPFSREDWEELRDLISENAGDLDMGLVTYAMTLVVDHGAI